MEQPITDYKSFFEGAKQAIRENEELKARQEILRQEEIKLEKSLESEEKAVADNISITIKRRHDEISSSYDKEMTKGQERLKKAKSKREKAKNQGIRARIEENTQELKNDISDTKIRMKTLFKQNGIPSFCNTNIYYALFMPRHVGEILKLLITILICFLAIPCGVYFLIPERKSFYLVLIYIAVIIVFGGIYLLINNKTKASYMNQLKDGLNMREHIRANNKKIKAIITEINKDKNDTVYDLGKYDDDIAKEEQDLADIASKKQDAISNFNTVTKTIISDEITNNSKPKIDSLKADIAAHVDELKTISSQLKEKSIYITDNYEVYLGKEFLSIEKIQALEGEINSGGAANISEAISTYKSEHTK